MPRKLSQLDQKLKAALERSKMTDSFRNKTSKSKQLSKIHALEGWLTYQREDLRDLI